MSIYDSNVNYIKMDKYYSINMSDFEMETPHKHERCEMMYLLSGRALVDVEGETYELKPGQFIFLDSNVTHMLRVPGEKESGVMNIEFSCWHDRPEGIHACIMQARECSANVQAFLKKQKRFFVVNASDNFGYVLKDLIAELDKPQKPDEFLIENLMIRVLCEIASSSHEQKQTYQITYIRLAIQYIAEHYTEDICVQDIADVAGTHRSYIQSLFKQEFGCGVMMYVNRMRISHAKFLLSNTQLRVIDIAEEAGFNSRQNFSLAFEKESGMTPNEYRRKTSNSYNIGRRYLVKPEELK